MKTTSKCSTEKGLRASQQFADFSNDFRHLESSPKVCQQRLLEEFYSFSTCQKLLKNFNYHFKNKTIFLNSMAHSSFAHEMKKVWNISNERLEFLGDAILDHVISVLLFEKFPHSTEGELSRLRGSLVNESMLVEWAYFLGIDEVILLGRGEVKKKSYHNPAILADAVEAFFAAVYLDSDFNQFKNLFIKFIDQFEKQKQWPLFSEKRLLLFDAKSKLQEYTMKKYDSLPEYREVNAGEKSTANPQNNFQFQLYLNGEYWGQAQEKSKKKAIKLLAENAIIKLLNQGEV